jgi:hypothetical protein
MLAVPRTPLVELSERLPRLCGRRPAEPRRDGSSLSGQRAAEALAPRGLRRQKLPLVQRGREQRL